MDEVDVPPFFLCPISLEIMKDPVTVSTGITYDRESIETWLFTSKNNTCPVTKQPVSVPDLTPNHTLRRLIQSWCTLNASRGVERIPTPKAPINKAQITEILNDAKSPHLQNKCLKRLKSIAAQSNTNKRCIEAAGAVEFLASIVTNYVTSSSSDNVEVSELFDCFDLEDGLSDEALSVLYNLHLSESGLKTLFGKNGEFIDSLTRVMQRGSYQSRAYAVLLMKSMFEVAEPMRTINLSTGFFAEVNQILHDQITEQSSKAALKLLVGVIPWGRNRVKAVEAGAVSTLIELLLDCSDKRTAEIILMVLELLCQCAEGRAEFLQHEAGIALVSKKILRVSRVGSERAVRILFLVSKFSATPVLLQEMLQVGVVAKLCLVLQVESGNKTKEKAREILKMHARTWRNSPCIPINFVSSYPS